MNENCTLHVLQVRRAVEREAEKLREKIGRLQQSYELLEAALNRGTFKTIGNRSTRC